MDQERPPQLRTEAVTPELALVDPKLAEAQRQTTERKAAMSSTEPSDGTFFVDPQGSPEPSPPAPVPLAEPGAAPVAPAPPRASAAVGQPAATPMLGVPLGTLIVRAGLLAEEQLEDALHEGMRTGKRLGEVLLDRGRLHERDLGRLLAGQKGLPFVEVSAGDAEPSALELLPEEKALLQCALPLRYEDGQLVIAVADPSNELVLENLRRTFAAEPRFVVATRGDLTRAIGEAYAQMPAGACTVAPVAPPASQLEPVPRLQVEPVEPVAAPASEERSPESPEVPPLQPLVAGQAPTLEPLRVAASVAPPVETAPQPPLPTPAVEPPMEAPPAPLLEQPIETPPATRKPEPTVEPETSSKLHIVLLRLRDGDMLEVGAFGTAADAAARAQEVVRQVAAAEGDATWPFFAERYLRPDTITSVDLLEEPVQKWMGSAVGSRWADQD